MPVRSWLQQKSKSHQWNSMCVYCRTIARPTNLGAHLHWSFANLGEGSKWRLCPLPLKIFHLFKGFQMQNGAWFPSFFLVFAGNNQNLHSSYFGILSQNQRKPSVVCSKTATEYSTCVAISSFCVGKLDVILDKLFTDFYS